MGLKSTTYSEVLYFLPPPPKKKKTFIKVRLIIKLKVCDIEGSTLLLLLGKMDGPFELLMNTTTYILNKKNYDQLCVWNLYKRSFFQLMWLSFLYLCILKIDHTFSKGSYLLNLPISGKIINNTIMLFQKLLNRKHWNNKSYDFTWTVLSVIIIDILSSVLLLYNAQIILKWSRCLCGVKHCQK